MLHPTEELQAMEDALSHLQQALELLNEAEEWMFESTMACKELHIAPDFRDFSSSQHVIEHCIDEWKEEIEKFRSEQPDPDAYDDNDDG